MSRRTSFLIVVFMYKVKNKINKYNHVGKVKQIIKNIPWWLASTIAGSTTWSPHYSNYNAHLRLCKYVYCTVEYYRGEVCTEHWRGFVNRLYTCNLKV